jgi:hypothetical protein
VQSNRMDSLLKLDDYCIYAPAKWSSGFLLRSPKMTIVVKGKGQTRSWLIIVPLPARIFYNLIYKNEQIRLQSLNTLLLIVSYQ